MAMPAGEGVGGCCMRSFSMSMARRCCWVREAARAASRAWTRWRAVTWSRSVGGLVVVGVVAGGAAEWARVRVVGGGGPREEEVVVDDLGGGVDVEAGVGLEDGVVVEGGVEVDVSDEVDVEVDP